MSLGKLLAAGKSVVNGRGAVAYREDKRACLPKFGAQKNPFITPAKTETPKSSSENSVAPTKISVPILQKTQKMPTISATSKSLASWTTKLNPMTMLRGAQSEVKVFSRQTVQTELSLDSVKVVHNDLTDAEVEVVPMKSRPARESTPSELQPAKQSWEILGERLFGVRTT